MATIRAAIGTILSYSTSLISPITYTDIAKVGDITGPSMSKETIDVTNHNNLDRYREFIGSLKNGGECKFDLYFDPADATQNSSTGVLSLFESDANQSFQLKLPPSFSPTIAWRFQGLVISWENKFAVTGAVMASCGIKISGKPLLS